MDKKYSKFENLGILVAIVSIAFAVEWVEKNPFTTIWLIVVIGFIAYRFLSNRNGDGDTPTTPPPSPF